MRGLVSAVIVSVVSISLLSTGSSVMAEQKCDVGFTGPDSNNMCVSQTTYKCTVANNNDVTITNENNQTVASGSVGNTGNTTGGSATSGTVSNSNGSTFNVTITNQADKICTATLVVPATTTPETPVQPTQPANGGGAAKAPVKSLPYTGTDSTMRILATVAGGSVAAAALGIAATAWYRYKKV